MSSSLIQLLPPSLLAHVACHLPVVSLLCLQRCSTTLHRLRADDAYMAAAWRWAELYVTTYDTRLHEWTIPQVQCIDRSTPHHQCLIPVSVWQAALPVWRAAVARMDEESESEDEQRERCALVEHEQPTMWILAKREADGSWKAMDEASAAAESADVERVEVLRDVDWWQLDEDMMPWSGDVEVRCGLVLRACPYLQHLRLLIDTYRCQAPSHADTFAFVPRLRTLVLERHDSGDSDLELLCDISAMLESLPHLTLLSCTSLGRLTIVTLLDIASHSTLEDVHISSGRSDMATPEWIGYELEFPVSVEDDERRMARLAADETLDGDVEAEDTGALEAAVAAYDGAGFASRQQLTGGAEERKEREDVRAEMQRMRTALTRTQPTKRSCEVRLALADWLHRRLRRGRLRTDEPTRSKSLLHRYRLLATLLRCTLRRQLSALAEETAAVSRARLPSSYWFSPESGGPSKRARVMELCGGPVSMSASSVVFLLSHTSS